MAERKLSQQLRYEFSVVIDHPILDDEVWRREGEDRVARGFVDGKRPEPRVESLLWEPLLQRGKQQPSRRGHLCLHGNYAVQLVKQHYACDGTKSRIAQKC